MLPVMLVVVDGDTSSHDLVHFTHESVVVSVNLFSSLFLQLYMEITTTPLLTGSTQLQEYLLFLQFGYHMRWFRRSLGVYHGFGCLYLERGTVEQCF